MVGEGRCVLAGGACTTPGGWVREDKRDPHRRPRQEDLRERPSGHARACGSTWPWSGPCRRAVVAWRAQSAERGDSRRQRAAILADTLCAWEVGHPQSDRCPPHLADARAPARGSGGCPPESCSRTDDKRRWQRRKTWHRRTRSRILVVCHVPSPASARARIGGARDLDNCRAGGAGRCCGLMARSSG
jgi:hypothetical protein